MTLNSADGIRKLLKDGGRDRTRTCDLLRVKHYGLVRFIEASGNISAAFPTSAGLPAGAAVDQRRLTRRAASID